MIARPRVGGNGKRLATQQSVNAAVKSICDIMRRSNCAGALQYVPELTWILFLRILDERETREARGGRGGGRRVHAVARDRRIAGRTGRRPTAASGASCRTGRWARSSRFVNGDLLPHLRRPARAAERHAAAEGDQRDHVRRRADAHRHRAQPARRARQGARDQRRDRRPDPRLHARRRSTRACC